MHGWLVCASIKLLGCTGLKDGQPLEGERQTANLADIVAGAFRDADGVRGFVTQSVADRPSRAMLYAL